MGNSATVILTARDAWWLLQPTTAQGGIQNLIARLRSGMRVIPGRMLEHRGEAVQTYSLTISEADLLRLPHYWKKTGGRPGSGGYQKRLPMESVREYLHTVAPLFSDGTLPPLKAYTWVYFKREFYGSPNIKIGKGGDSRSRTGKVTDNPRLLVTLLRMHETAERDEDYYHQKFNHLRIDPKREWFRPGEDLMAFIHDGMSKIGKE